MLMHHTEGILKAVDLDVRCTPRRWHARGLMHAVFRVGARASYFTLCEYRLPVRSHRAVSDHGVVTCLRCLGAT